jgi:hypothetical protein
LCEEQRNIQRERFTELVSSLGMNRYVLRERKLEQVIYSIECAGIITTNLVKREIDVLFRTDI